MKRKNRRYYHSADRFNCIGKGAFIRKYGREAWERVKKWPGAISKNGRRVWIAREAIEDNLHMVDYPGAWFIRFPIECHT